MANILCQCPTIHRFSGVQFYRLPTQEIAIAGKQELMLSLNRTYSQLDEVVVVGYGTQKKREVTGSISTVKGDELASLATPSFDGQLAGRSAGVQITTQTGVLGEAPRLRIRGIGSISSGNYPLVVVDGSSNSDRRPWWLCFNQCSW